MVVSGRAKSTADEAPGFLDELSTLGETHVAEFYQDRGFMCAVMSPDGFPLQRATLADLAGSEADGLFESGGSLGQPALNLPGGAEVRGEAEVFGIGRLRFEFVNALGQGVADLQPARVRYEPSINWRAEWFIGFDPADDLVAADHFVMRAAGADRHRERYWQQFRHRQ